MSLLKHQARVRDHIFVEKIDAVVGDMNAWKGKSFNQEMLDEMMKELMEKKARKIE